MQMCQFVVIVKIEQAENRDRHGEGWIDVEPAWAVKDEEEDRPSLSGKRRRRSVIDLII